MNRVHNLAGEFKSGSTSQRGPDLSTGSPAVSTPRKDGIPQSCPLTECLESFRLQLPGGWESISSTPPARASRIQDNSSEGDQMERTILLNALDQPKETFTPDTARLVRAESPAKLSNSLDRSLPKLELAQPSGELFTAMVVAGTKLEDAISAFLTRSYKDSPPKTDLPPKEVISAPPPQSMLPSLCYRY